MTASRLPLLDLPVPCPACGGADVQPFHVYRNRQHESPYPWLALLGCAACGLCFTHPRPTPDEAAAYYEADANSGWSRGKSLEDPRGLEKADRRFEVKREAARAKWQHLAPYVKLQDAGGREPAAFDFGCGGGALLDALKESGWVTSGLEPHRMRLLAALRHTILTAIPREPQFDLAIISHVLEHLLDPVGVLRQLAAATRPGGYLFAAVPDVDGLPAHGDFCYVAGIVHVNSFTMPALENAVRLAGWQPARSFHGNEWERLNPADTKRHALLAIKASDAPVPLVPGALDASTRALRAYSSRMNEQGKFEHPGDRAATKVAAYEKHPQAGSQDPA
jgi:SAM-dependent methyltransferase